MTPSKTATRTSSRTAPTSTPGGSGSGGAGSVRSGAAPSRPGAAAARGRERRRRATAWADAAVGGRIPGSAARWDTPATTWYVLVGATTLMVALGLVMVLSSSSVESYAEQDAAGRSALTAVGPAVKQAAFALVGLGVAWVVSRVPIRWWRAPAGLPLLAVVAATALQVLVFTPLGQEVGGNRNWIRVGPLTLQPSELLKLASVVWCAAVLARNRARLARFGPAVVPVALGTLPGLALVVHGRDLGTAMVLAGVVLAALFAAGVRLRHLAVLVGPALLAVAVAALTSANRRGRIEAFFAGGSDPQGVDWQSVHSQYALASGGLTGLGLGASREKWSWLPEAHNDFIFAIVGEELGLLGTLTVLFLLASIAWACARTVRASRELFVKVAVGGVLAWILGQALVNIAVVIGLLPVLGVPLPLISSGGSALIAALAAIGLVLACVRSLPGAARTLAARPSSAATTLAVTTAPRPAPAPAAGPAPRRSR